MGKKKEEKEKLNLFTLSLEELREAVKTMDDHHATCSGRECSDCASSHHNVDMTIIGQGCQELRNLAKAILAIREEYEGGEKDAKMQTCNGRCGSCKWLDSELFKKSGYRFCKHWHNFTISGGFCYAYEGVENP